MPSVGDHHPSSAHPHITANDHGELSPSPSMTAPAKSTPEILELLHRYHAPATIFQCGVNVRRLPDIARAIRLAGHEIGNHSYTHPRFYFQSARWARTEAQRQFRNVASRQGSLWQGTLRRITVHLAPYKKRPVQRLLARSESSCLPAPWLSRKSILRREWSSQR